MGKHKHISDAPAMTVYVDYSEDESTNTGGVSPRSAESIPDYEVMASVSDDRAVMPGLADEEDTHEYKIKDKFDCNLE